MKNTDCFDYFFDRTSFLRMEGGDWPLVVNSYSGAKTLGGAHYHDFCELAVITGGRGVYLDAEGRRYELHPGMVFVLLPGMIHNYVEQHDLAVTNVLWVPDELKMPLYDLETSPGYHALFELEPGTRSRSVANRARVLDPDALGEVEALLRRLRRELIERPPGAWLMAVSLLGQLFTMLCRSYAASGNERTGELLKLDRALAFIHKNYMTGIRRAQLAKLASMSEANFFRHFKRALGRTPGDYLNEVRLLHVREMLLESDAGLAEIAVKCGFSDGNHLGVAFKRHFGDTPHRYRIEAWKKQGKG